MLACLGDVRSGPKIPLQMVHTNIEQENFRCSWCWNGAAFHRWLNLHQVNWIHSFWIHHCTSGMFPSIGVVACQAIILFQPEWRNPISHFRYFLTSRKSEKIQGLIYIYIISLQNALKKKSLLCFDFPIANMFEKTKPKPLGSTSKRVETSFNVWTTAKEGIEGVKMALRVLRECQSLVIQQRGGELWRVWELMCLASLGNRLKTLLQDNYVVRICIYVWIRVGFLKIYVNICKLLPRRAENLRT